MRILLRRVTEGARVAMGSGGGRQHTAARGAWTATREGAAASQLAAAASRNRWRVARTVTELQQQVAGGAHGHGGAAAGVGQRRCHASWRRNGSRGRAPHDDGSGGQEVA